jgi:putative transcriptional regulator
MESLRGQLLVAGPDLLDPNFRRSVLLVGEHGDEGAMGVILNRPSPVSVADAVPPLADLSTTPTSSTSAAPCSRRRSSCSATSATRTRRLLSCSARSASCPPRSRAPPTSAASTAPRVFAGYAGWGPGQLESEIAEESWIIEQALPEDVFTEDQDDLWSAGAAPQGRRLRRAGADAARPEQQLDSV